MWQTTGELCTGQPDLLHTLCMLVPYRKLFGYIAKSSIVRIFVPLWEAQRSSETQKADDNIQACIIARHGH